MRSGTVEVDLADFVVASWWTAKHNIPPHLSRPEFDNVVTLEVATAGGAVPGDYRFYCTRLNMKCSTSPAKTGTSSSSAPG